MRAPPRFAAAWAGLLALLMSAATQAAFTLDMTQLNEITPRPGTVIDTTNLPRYAHLLDPDFARFVAGGFTTVEVDEPLEFMPHPAFVSATARFGAQTRLGPRPGLLEDFVQGLPFPGEPRRDDPDAGVRTAWNMRYAYTGDSGLLPELHWQMRDWKSGQADLEMQFEARGMRFMYRHVMPPIPAIADNPQDAFAAFLLRAVDAGSYDGAEALVFSNRDESREVNGWVYLPQLGRTQSLASFSTRESMFGSDILPTDFLVYSGRLVDMHWRYLGHTYMLLPMYRHDRVRLSERKARRYDYWHVAFDGHAGCFPRVQWQLRPVLILEGTAVADTALVRKRVFYVDAQTHVAPLWKIYREDGRLWKFALAAYAHPDSHLPDNHESGAPIESAFSTIDLQTNRCTTVQVLTLVNSPEVEADDFDTAGMQGRGRRR